MKLTKVYFGCMV